MKKASSALLLLILVIGLLVSCNNELPDNETESLIGTKGQAGGIIVFDKGEYSDGWRFLEAAPHFIVYKSNVPTIESTFSKDYENLYFGFYDFAGEDNTIICTPNASIGAGKENTDLLVAGIGDKSAVTKPGTNYTTKNYCAKACADLVVEHDGVTYDDWFLPSIEELKHYELVYYSNDNNVLSNLYSAKIASSSTIDEDSIWCLQSDWATKASREDGFLVLPFRRY